MRGKLIVFEGTDGSGKGTQARLMAQRLRDEQVAFREIDFPRYGNPFAEPARLYLAGALGDHPGDVSAYAASTLFAVDRYASYKEDWGKDYEAGKVILANRYTTSNAVHQGGKVPPEEQGAFFRWLFDFEYRRLGLPEPDLVLYLDMPTEQAVAMLRQREAATHTQGDIHETDTAYLAQCRQTAQAAAAAYGWQRVPCLNGAGQLRRIEEIHREIWQAVRPLLEAKE